jgi:hypothetical protein
VNVGMTIVARPTARNTLAPVSNPLLSTMVPACLRDAFAFRNIPAARSNPRFQKACAPRWCLLRHGTCCLASGPVAEVILPGAVDPSAPRPSLSFRTPIGSCKGSHAHKGVRNLVFAADRPSPRMPWPLLGAMAALCAAMVVAFVRSTAFRWTFVRSPGFSLPRVLVVVAVAVAVAPVLLLRRHTSIGSRHPPRYNRSRQSAQRRSWREGEKS